MSKHGAGLVSSEELIGAVDCHGRANEAIPVNERAYNMFIYMAVVLTVLARIWSFVWYTNEARSIEEVIFHPAL